MVFDHPSLYDNTKPNIISRLLEPIWKVLLVVVVPTRLIIFLILTFIGSLFDRLLNIGTD